MMISDVRIPRDLKVEYRNPRPKPTPKPALNPTLNFNGLVKRNGQKTGKAGKDKRGQRKISKSQKKSKGIIKLQIWICMYIHIPTQSVCSSHRIGRHDTHKSHAHTGREQM